MYNLSKFSLITLVIVQLFSTKSIAQSHEDFVNAKGIDDKITVAESLAYDYIKSNLDSLKIIGIELLTAANNSKHELGIHQGRKHIGNYKIRTAQIDEGLVLLRGVKNYFLSHENYAAVTEVCNEIGNGYQYAGKIDIAIKWYKESLKYGKIAADDNIKNIALINLAQAYILTSNFEKAEKTALEYRDWVLSIGSIDAVSNAYAVLGNIELQQENFVNAISYFQHCEKFARKSGSKVQLAHAYTNLGISAFYLGEKEKCLSFFLKALEVNKTVKNTKIICDNYLNLGGIYFEMSEFENARLYYEEGHKLAIEGDIYSSQLEFLEALIELNEEMKIDATKLKSELKLLKEEEIAFINSKNEVDQALANELNESVKIQENGFESSESKIPFYVGSLILFLVFVILALRKRLV